MDMPDSSAWAMWLGFWCPLKGEPHLCGAHLVDERAIASCRLSEELCSVKRVSRFTSKFHLIAGVRLTYPTTSTGPMSITEAVKPRSRRYWTKESRKVLADA